MISLRGELAGSLLDAQGADGGWGATRAAESNTEATALALCALHCARVAGDLHPLERGARWLAERQRPDGSWPFSAGVDEPSWATSLAALSLAQLEREPERVSRAGSWLLAQEGRRYGFLSRMILRLMPEERRLRLDPDLIGWPWHRGSFSWVEPTSLALLALKKMGPRLAAEQRQGRVQQGEALIYDRMCRGGGWNYGNSTVLGEELEPYPDVTAVALLALQDRAAEPANQSSLAALEKMLDERASGLTLSWAIACFSVYGRETARWREQLARRYAATGLLAETRAVALALLALEDAVWLRI